MIPATLLPFLKDLRDHNQKEWMDENRKRYESNKSSFELLVEKLIAEIARFDNSISELKPKQCTFRINRDIRFSKNKSPYKTNFAAYFNPNGKQNSGAGYYLHIEPGNCFLAGGIWMPESNELSKIRQEIDYNLNEWLHIVENKNILKSFESIHENEKTVRPPKGYLPDNPAIEYLKLKSIILQKKFSDIEVQQPSFIKDVLKHFKMLTPLITFVNRSIEG